MHMETDVKRWTIEELHSLPDDGNSYELSHGELFVSPAPAEPHDTTVARLNRLLVAYVAANRLGLVYHPHSVVRFGDSQAEPDLIVRHSRAGRPKHARVDDDLLDWPIPSLVIEVVSPSSRRRDREQKREYYVEAGVAENWVVDPERRNVRVVRPGHEDVVATQQFEWHPVGVSQPLAINVDDIFEGAD